MIVLLTGATGFIGRHLARSLRAHGHRVIVAGRHVSEDAVKVDYTKDLSPRDWIPRLAGVDTVINAVGIIRERGEQTFESIHTAAPRALFAACAEAGVRRVVQISALGAQTGTTRYFSSKRAADEFLATLPLDWTIVQPALVYGRGGTSAKLFTMLASLPIVPLPGAGEQRIQPIHVADLVEAIVQILGRADTRRQRVALVGPRDVSFRDFLGRLRGAMGLRSTRFLRVPAELMRLGASIASALPGSLLDRETLTMLEAGNTADPALTIRLLGGRPRDIEDFIGADERELVRRDAQLRWWLPLLRASVAAVWLWTGIVSLWLYPLELSFELLARTGITGGLATLALYGAAALDLFFGAATLLLRNRRALWIAQAALILGYTIIITARLPEYWLHPYGPILKNLPMLAVLGLLYTLEDAR
jgi:uncharacterized protein YbjT (DUF2867 family)